MTAHARLAWIVPATHVCGRWRAAAIAHPRLWTEIASEPLGVQWALEMARRARQAPVDVSTDANRTPLLDYVVEYIDRVRHLQLNRGDPSDVVSLLARLNRPAPMLESVKIYCSSTSTLPCPADLFAHTTPRLRHICLVNYYVPPNHAMFVASLVSLKICTHAILLPASELSPTYTCDELLDVLERLPALEVLHVEPLPSPSPALMSTHRSVSFPRLEALSLKGPLDGCHWLAAILDLPAHASIQMICSSLPDTGQDCQLLVPFMARRVAAAAAMHTIEHLAMSITSDTAIRLSLGPLEARRAPSSALPLDVAIYFSSSSGATIRELVEAFCAVIPLGGLRELSVSTGLEGWWRPQHWQEMLRPAQCVETVNVRGAAARHLVSSLGRESRAGEPPDEAPSLLFPALKTLALWGLTIHDDTSETPRLDDELVGALAHRTHKAPLETLRFLRCNVQKKWIEKIEAIVPTVTLDFDAQFPLPRQ